jgi:pimeloyl-ACP methyl ester carboxylesterase
MPFANNQGVRIHYEVEGKGPPLVLLHGLGGSLEMWRETGHVEALKDDYRLILIDARGHGVSDKPHDPESYGMELMVTDVVAVLDDINVNKAHFLGYSMSGVIGFGIAKYVPERFRTLIIGSAQPYNQDSWKNNMLHLFRKGRKATLVAVEEMWGPRMTPWVKTVCLTNDLKALIALTSARWLSLEDVLPTMTMPCLIFVGEIDGVYSDAKKCVESISNATFVSLPGLNHIECLYRTDLVLPHITQFLMSVDNSFS